MPANRLIGYYRMYEWRAKARMCLTHAQGDLNAPSSHGAAHIKKLNVCFVGFRKAYDTVTINY